MKIYKNKFGGWSALCTNDYQGKKTHCYLSLGFRKGQEPSGDEGNIKVTEFFMSCFEGKNGVQPKLFVQDYIYLMPKTEESNPLEDADASKFGGVSDVDPDDLHFY